MTRVAIGAFLTVALAGCATSAATGRLMQPDQFEIATVAARTIVLGTTNFRLDAARPAVCVGDEFPERNFGPYQAALATKIDDTAQLVLDGRECRQRGNEIQTEDGEVPAVGMWVGEVEFRTSDFAVIPIEISATRDRTFWYEVWVRKYGNGPEWLVDEAFCRPGSYDGRGLETPRRGGTRAGLAGRFCVPVNPDVTGR